MTVYRAAIWVRDYLERKDPPCPLSQPARIMAQYLASKSDEKAESFPGNELLARVAGVTEKNVYRYVNEIVATGLIAIVRGGGRGHHTTFRFPFVELPSANGDRPFTNGRKPRASAVVFDPQPPRPRGDSLSTTPAPTRRTYPEPPRDVSTTPAPARLNPRAHADPSRREVGEDREVARPRRRTNATRDPLGALITSGISPFTGRQMNGDG